MNFSLLKYLENMKCIWYYEFCQDFLKVLLILHLKN